MLQKLPFTIPELVQASPCRSSDGILYTGKKLKLKKSDLLTQVPLNLFSV